MARKHEVTIRIALGSGALHGGQGVSGGHWRIEPDCVRAYLSGEKCEHKRSSKPIRLPRRSA